ncbi:hypothetical protein SAMN04489727_5734 [Amycolatopsis tolypomycina]|uniref:Uncharacterized protein n=1 Tax=Amycolatopsis tolypomycina TaxID=208445 RepID=A0A1H4WPU5_9PSEU|nr:hypothetical protein [Amycolatopsis tolypomycina]SEC95285.1 hypothetical protein SAMN04489727_5734 [Amycolatopsis tolypomycina]
MSTPAVLVPQGDPLAPTESLAPVTAAARTFHTRARAIPCRGSVALARGQTLFAAQVAADAVKVLRRLVTSREDHLVIPALR